MRAAALIIAQCVLAAALGAQQPDSSALRCPHGPADDQATLVSAAVAADSSRLAATIDTVLRDLAYRISSAETRPGQWVTLPRFSWPAGTDSAGWHGSENPGVELIVDVAADTVGLRLSVAAAAVCLTGTMAESRRPGSVEATLETVSAMEART